MWDFIVLGGPVMWVIMVIGFFAVVLVIERLLYLKKISTDEEKLFLHVKTSLMEGHFNEAIAICDNNLSPLATLLQVGIRNRQRPEEVMREMLKDAAAQEAPKLEKGLSELGTISNISPLLGLLGTVTGTMRAFGVLAKFGSATDPTQLASGVSEALITTVGGLVVAIPVVICYNFLVSRVNGILNKLETEVNSLVQTINEANNLKGQRSDVEEE